MLNNSNLLIEWFARTVDAKSPPTGGSIPGDRFAVGPLLRPFLFLSDGQGFKLFE